MGLLLLYRRFFGFGVSRLPSWYGYIGVPFIYAVYLLLPAFFIFLFSFVKSLAAVRREKRTGRARRIIRWTML